MPRISSTFGGKAPWSMVSATFGFFRSAATLADFGSGGHHDPLALGPETDRNDSGVAVEAVVRHPGRLGAVEQLLRVRLGQNLGDLFAWSLMVILSSRRCSHHGDEAATGSSTSIPCQRVSRRRSPPPRRRRVPFVSPFKRLATHACVDDRRRRGDDRVAGRVAVLPRSALTRRAARSLLYAR